MMGRLQPRILAISPTRAASFEPRGLTAIGGLQSTGHVVEGLRHSDDYAILSPDADGVQIHPLKGKLKESFVAAPFQPIALGDLTLLVLPAEPVPDLQREPLSADVARFENDLLQIVPSLAQTQNMDSALHSLLETMSAMFRMEKGLLITRTAHVESDAAAKFKIVGQIGVNPRDPWLSETLIQDVLGSGTGTFVQNIFGSRYDSRKSLIATGFISVFAWPLVVRGETVGVLVLGSAKPHSGLSNEERRKAEVFVQVAALALHFHLRDLRLREELEILRRTHPSDDSPFLTQNASLLETSRLAVQVAATDLAVLIQGETGVGKEVMANWIHARSDRRGKAFIAVNCGAIPTELLESLLFGHRKGAFTGAHADQIGKFQMADGGTLFLDEIGDLPESLQVKLLRVLQQRQIEPLGCQKAIDVDVRVIAASHKNLLDLMACGRFREDLYYRLAEITLEIPPLRRRPEDIGLLALSFLKMFAPEKRFSAAAWEWLAEQPWKGNVRELMSAVKRAAILSRKGEIQREDFLKGRPAISASSRDESASSNWLGGATLEEAKADFVLGKVREALKRAGGHRAKAADLLGITQRTLFRYLEEQRDNLNELSV